ncbi:ribokinase [Trinickia dinghuensis]|uniref:Ribokinase n=1 Tax=Trinickia dinghuensis TaxID=2291023 RepID=A0A3D8JWJ5_9BURK|nr:ribokinase [Trinickia dinghuensis]RDU97447.1 ribokinase [Trinickia dinghuensis]
MRTTAVEQQSGRVTVVGSLNMDLVIRAPRLPSAGETLAGRSFDHVPGGKGGNQAVAAARLGAQVAMIGCVGDDDNGKQLVAGLHRDGIDCNGVATDAALPTGVAMIVVDDAGQNAIVIVAGSNGALMPAAIAEQEAAIAQADVLVCQLEVPGETVLAAMQKAHALGRTVVFNPAPVTGPLSREWLESSDFVIPNEIEASVLSGVAVDSPESARRAAKVLQQGGARNVIITLGKRGVLVLAEGEGEEAGKHYLPAEVEAIDTTAAGDTFVGGFCAALAAKRPLDEAVRFGQAAAALSVTRAGAQTSIPYLHEITFQG